MPTTPDRPARDAGRPAGPEDSFATAEAAHLAARDTVPVDVRPRDETPFDVNSRDAEDPRDPEDFDVRPRDPGDDADAGPFANRETVRLPRQRGRPKRPGRAPFVVAVAFATLWAALLSYLPVAVVMGLARSLEGTGGIAGSAKVGLAAWLLGHGVPLGTTIGSVGLAPLLLTLLIGWRLNRAGVHVTRAIGARHSGALRDALFVAGAVGLGYAAIGVLATLVVSSPGLTVSAVRAGVCFAVVGFAGALIGSLRSTDAVLVLARRTPDVLRHGLRTGMVAALLVLAAGAGFTGLSVAIGGGHAAEMIGAYQTGVAGQAGITLVSLAYGANASVWAAAYLLGPGFLLGTGTTVSLTQVTVGPLPTLPLLAGLPEGPVGATGAALLAVPVLAGMVAGWLLTRRLRRDGPGTFTPASTRTSAARQPTGATLQGSDWSLVIGAALLAGPVAGAVLGALTWMSSGSLGAGRLAQIGPVPWLVALVATGVVAVSAAIGAAATRGFRSPPRP
jgi:hypothetical protein